MQSEKLAAVGRLASSIAHEINNPLAAITNLIYLGRASSEMTQIQKYLETADQEVRLISVIANQTLRFHKDTAAPAAVDITELVQGALSLYQGKLANAKVSVLLKERGAEESCLRRRADSASTNEPYRERH